MKTVEAVVWRCLVLVLLFAAEARAQDMEPRRWSHLPSGLNVAGLGVGAIDGDIFFDPVVRLEDATFELYTLGSSYVRTFEWLGKSSRIDFRLPYGYGRWEGLLNGEDVSVRRHGPLDPHLRLSVNLYGAPPLKGQAYLQYRAEHPVTTTVGAAISVTLPLGEYYAERLINLGGNRYVVHPQLGVLHQRGPWQFELTTTLSLFEDNNEFFADTRLEQDPLGFVQLHAIRSLARGRWGSVSTGFSYGGEAFIDGVPKDNDQRTRYYALSFGMPLSPQQSVKISYVNAETNVLLGTNSDSLLLSWSLAWSE
ncbi:MAG: transporter [Lysobacterales bacterium]